MNTRQFNPPAVKYHIDIFKQIDYFNTGEMHPTSAEALLKRAKATIKAYSATTLTPKAQKELTRLQEFVKNASKLTTH